jgi:hypothetical protein
MAQIFHPVPIGSMTSKTGGKKMGCKCAKQNQKTWLFSKSLWKLAKSSLLSKDGNFSEAVETLGYLGDGKA